MDRLLFLEGEGKVGSRWGREGKDLDLKIWIDLVSRLINLFPKSSRETGHFQGGVNLEGEPAPRFPLPTFAPLR